ncbi:MAG TPA: glycoside hydrolase family 97 N-terminal domain-containing protein, partial [Duganella sp.]|uniref:glycoside hydrolase family 97 N-terminal domain-containing protein n=1 Tax=Duganella sp. TaxID=1904440 RepID=UPI002ED4859B
MQRISSTMAAAVASALYPLFCLSAAAAPGVVAIASPNGGAVISIARDASRFSIARAGETIIADSPLGLEFDDVPGFGPLTLEKQQGVSVDRTIPLVAPKAAEARDRYRGATLVFRERAAKGRRL